MKKRILFFSILIAMTLTASATDFITDVMLLGNKNQSSFNSMLSDLTAAGWTDINKDLNAGCGSGSDYIHLLYRKQSSLGNTGVPITDFYIRTGNNPPNSLTHEGRTYYLVPCNGSESFTNSQGDLNNNAGGANIHLYYTRDALTNNHGVTGITFNTTQSGAVGENGGSTGYDLNSGCGSNSAYIYMHVATTSGANVVTLSSGSGEIQLRNGHILTGTGGADTKVIITDGATVTLSGVNITAIANDENHEWPGIWCVGNAVIVLGEGTTNTVNGGYESSGIYVPSNKTLTIQGSGTLNATGAADAAGIGSGYQSTCGNITISGGTVNAAGGDYAAGIGSGSGYQSSCGNITISGGTITATGGYSAAGIGGGSQSSSGSITISRGTVTATGGLYGAGIGSGSFQSSYCENITISGGIVNATGGDFAAGIGSATDQSSCGNIAINVGTVTATGGYGAPGIGSGKDYSSCGNITISGGTVTATGGDFAAGIGSGFQECDCGSISITQNVTQVTATKGNYIDNAIGAGYHNSTCGTVTIGTVETGFITQSPFTTFPYTVAFNANGGTGTMANQFFMYNVAQNLSANSFTRTDYEFYGWVTTPSGPKVYDDNQSVSNLTDTPGATVTLYAKWRPINLSKAIAGYGTGGGWNLIASPIVDFVRYWRVDNLTVGDYDLYRFNQSNANGKEWENIKATTAENHPDFTGLVSGQGYLYANSIDITLYFHNTPWEVYNMDVIQDVELNYDGTATFAGWNLVGNPFTETAYFADNRPFYKMNAEGSEIIAATSNSIEVMEGVFVVATEDGEILTFTTTVPVSNSKGLAVNISRANRGGSTSAVIDRAIIRFDGGQTLGKFTLHKDDSRIYIPQDGEEYAIVNAETTGEIPVNFKASKNGTYTISVDVEGLELGYLHLIDNLTGLDVDLLATPSYSFEAKTTDYASRFKLVFSADSEDGPSTGSGTFAYISDGNIIINDGPSTPSTSSGTEGSGTSTLQIVDVTGRIVVTRGGRIQCVPTSGMTPGVYVLRLINGDDVKTQKIVIE